MEIQLNLFWHVPMDLLILLARTMFGNSSIWLLKFLWNSCCRIYLSHIEIDSFCYWAYSGGSLFVFVYSCYLFQCHQEPNIEEKLLYREVVSINKQNKREWGVKKYMYPLCFIWLDYWCALFNACKGEELECRNG